MIAIDQLRYVRLGTRDLDASADFARRILGLELIEKDNTQAVFRSDFRDHTLVFTNDIKRTQTVGFEVRDTETLERAADTLARNGYDVMPGTPEEAARRKVKFFASFIDASGVTIDLVVRPLHSGWRYFPSRDAGITGLEAVALRSTAVAKGEALWTGLLGGKVSDWVGDAAFIRFDAAHHRLVIYPSSSGGVLAVEFKVESVDQLMQSSYFLQDQQVRIAHGPGRRPVSDQMFLTFAGPDGVLFSYVAEGSPIAEATHRPRQFPPRAQSFCAWGSRSDIPEFNAETGNEMDGARA
jgi:2,3-dihydroxy-p-cumate/2,3-dihydroxybenzoate 3,4-dioxygenase